jgi:hypothetical protein
LAVDVKSKQILALEAMDESIKECEMLKPLIEKAKIKRALADGAFDSKENFNYLSQMGIESGINVRKKRVKINKREGIKINR